jgi:hypothetical protein
MHTFLSFSLLYLHVTMFIPIDADAFSLFG